MIDEFLAILKGTKISKTPIYAGFLNSLSDIKRRGQDRVEALRKLAPRVVGLFGVADIVEWDIGVADIVEWDIKFVTVYIGAAIVSSFLALFASWNGLEYLVWPLFFLLVGLMSSAADYYYSTWKSMRWISDMIDNTTFAMERANAAFSSNNKH